MEANDLPPNDQFPADTVGGTTSSDQVSAAELPIETQAGIAEAGTLDTSLTGATADVDTTLSGLNDELGTFLGWTISDINTQIDDLIGSLDNALTQQDDQVVNIIARITAQTIGTLDDQMTGLQDAGFNVPMNSGLISQMTTTDPASWIGTIFPDNLQQHSTGDPLSPPPPPSPPTVPPTVPPASPPPPYVDPYFPPPPPQSPPPPPNSPPSAPPPPDCPSTCPAPVVSMSCPPPGNVTVNIPPSPPITQTVTCGDTTVTTQMGGGTATSPITSGSDTGGGAGGDYSNPESPPTTPPPPPGSPPTVPPPPPIAEAQLPPIKGDASCMDWDVLDPCIEATKVQGKPLPDTTVGSGAPGRKAGDSWYDTFISAGKAGIEMSIPGYSTIKAASQAIPAAASLLSFGVQHDLGVTLATDIVKKLSGVCVKDIDAITALSMQLGAANWAHMVTQSPIDYLTQSIRYQLQYIMPTNLITQADIDMIYLKGYVLDSQWECITKANGNMPHWHRAARDAKQAVLPVGDIVQSWRRGLIGNEDLDRGLNRNGFIDPVQKTLARQLSDLPPGASDIVRFMGRDTFDQKAIDKYQLDTDFGIKFTDDAARWFYWQGYSTEIAKHYWRAHWTYASNTQLYEGLHRLRPDRKEVKDWQAARDVNQGGGGGDPEDTGPVVITRQDVIDAMKANDIAPYFIDMLIACSYHPITYSDATRMYMIGFIDKSELAERFQDNGYTSEDANTLANYWEYETNKRIRTQSRVLQPSKVITYFKIGAMNDEEARDALKDAFPNSDQVDEILKNTITEMEAEAKTAVIKGIRASYMMGEYDEEVLPRMLELNGVAPEAVARLVRQWTGEKSAQHRAVSAAMLCKWSDRNLISQEDHRNRLRNLGYNQSDASRIARTCEIDSDYKKKRRARQEAKEALADAKAAGAMTLAKLMAEIKAMKAFADWVAQATGSTPPGGSGSPPAKGSKSGGSPPPPPA